jgi:hypothetical protein
MSGVAAIVDDILVYGRRPQGHNENLTRVLNKCRSAVIKLNENKLQIEVQQVEYFGHILYADGLKPDPSKVAAMREMEPPSNKSELQTIMGMITYLSKFAPNLANITSPLRQLLLRYRVYMGCTSGPGIPKGQGLNNQNSRTVTYLL